MSICPDANSKQAKPRRLLRISDAIERLSCGKTTFYSYVNEGHIELVKLGTSSRVPEDALERFIANLPKLKPRRVEAAHAAA